MLKTTINLITSLQNDKENLEHEVKKLKKKLGYAHTRINDLRYAKKQRDKFIDSMKKPKSKLSLEDAIYAACLAAANSMTKKQIKSMSWFGRNKRFFSSMVEQTTDNR